jgi:hypothetical protein
MATNVYRAEQLTYFCDVPFRQQGYFMSTSSDCFSVFSDEETWEPMEARALKMFPDCDPIRGAGFALIVSETDDWSDYAYDYLVTEIQEYIDIESADIYDIAEQIAGDSDAGPEQSEGE